MISSRIEFSRELLDSGSNVPMTTKHAIQGPEDYASLAYIFENLKVIPDYDGVQKWIDETGDSSLCVSYCTFGASPMHAIQRDLIDPTQFFLHYNDFPKEMQRLTEAIEGYYNGMLEAAVNSPAQAIGWGGNYDDTITYPAYYEKELKPWLIKAGNALRAKGKVLVSHVDGENHLLMKLLKASKIDVAEAICPFPMTKVKIDDYYTQWNDQTTIYGGIPSNILVPELVSDDEFKDYIDSLLKCITPGSRFVVGIADTTPPGADFDRLRYLGDKIDKEGRLPLKADGFNPIDIEASSLKKEAGPWLLIAQTLGKIGQTLSDVGRDLEKMAQGLEAEPGTSEEKKTDQTEATDNRIPESSGIWQSIQDDILNGDNVGIQAHIKKFIADKHSAKEIIDNGLLPPMDVIGAKFTDGTVFIPEVLLSARAMHAALEVLEPYLKEDGGGSKGVVMIGTVKGDHHDIGKNLVSTMIKGQGFDVMDLGINIPVETFVQEVRKHKPDILGLSALLTTTMPEMAKVVDAMEEAGLRDTLKIMIGGAPVTEKFAKDVGADAYLADGGMAAAYCKSVLK